MLIHQRSGKISLNLRIKKQELRFRISKEDLKSLCEGVVVEENTYMPDESVLTQRIQLESASTEQKLNFSSKMNEMILTVQKQAAIAFYHSLPNREGISCSQEIKGDKTLDLILEVDVFTQKRKRD